MNFKSAPTSSPLPLPLPRNFSLKQIILALDTTDLNHIQQIIDTYASDISWYKVGMELFYTHGEKVISLLAQKNLNIFLDLKLYDIPNTVAQAVKTLTSLPVQMLTVHLSGGLEMLKAAIINQQTINIIGVSVLTSFSEQTWQQTFLNASPITEQVLHFAAIAKSSNCYGIVCSGHEIQLVKHFNPHIITIVPGIRMNQHNTHDQKRVLSPVEALSQGADFIVMGRELTEIQTGQKLSDLRDQFRRYFANNNK